MTDSEDLQQFPLALLAHRCSRESERFTNHQPYDTRFCFELFRRALQDGDTEAWGCVYHQYQRLVLGWVHRHSQFVQTGEDADFLANRAFESMWHAFTSHDPHSAGQRIPNPEKFERFDELGKLLQYLQMCVHSAVREAIPPTLPYAELTESAIPTTESRIESPDREQFWSLINACLRDDKERLVVQSLFLLSLKPREIYQQHQALFEDVVEIYRIRDNARERLRRCAALKEFLD